MRPNAFHGGLFESFVNRKNVPPPTTQVFSGSVKGRNTARYEQHSLDPNIESQKSICKNCSELKAQKDNLMLELTNLRLKNDKAMDEKLNRIENELFNQKGLVDHLEGHVQTLESKQQALEIEKADLLELVELLSQSNKSLNKQLAHERQQLEVTQELKLDLDKKLKFVSEERDLFKNLILKNTDNKEGTIFDDSCSYTPTSKEQFSTSLDHYLFDTNSTSQSLTDSALLDDKEHSKISSIVSKNTMILNTKENCCKTSKLATFKDFTGQYTRDLEMPQQSKFFSNNTQLSKPTQNFTISISDPPLHHQSEISNELPLGYNQSLWDEPTKDDFKQDFRHDFRQDLALNKHSYKTGKEISSPNFDIFETSTCASTPGDQKIIENSNFSGDELLKIVSPIEHISKTDQSEASDHHDDSIKLNSQGLHISTYDFNVESNNIEYTLENIAEFLASHCLDDSDDLIEYPSLNALTYPIDREIINKSASYLIEWSTSTSFLNRFSLSQVAIPLNLFLFKYLSHVSKFLESLVTCYIKNAYDIHSGIHQQNFDSQDFSESLTLATIFTNIQDSFESSEIDSFRLTQESIMQLTLLISYPTNSTELEKELVNFLSYENPYLDESNIAYIGKLIGKIIFTTSSAMKCTYLELATIIFFIFQLGNSTCNLTSSNNLIFQTLKSYINFDHFSGDLLDLQELVTLCFKEGLLSLDIPSTIGAFEGIEIDMIKLEAIKFSIQLFSSFFGFFWTLQYPLSNLMDHISSLEQISKGSQMCLLAAIEGLSPQSTLLSDIENPFLENIDSDGKNKIKFSFYSVIAVYDNYCKENNDLLNDPEASIATINTLTDIFEQYKEKLGFE